MSFVDLTGQSFERWTVLSLATPYVFGGRNVPTKWRCQCICGAYRDVRTNNLLSGRSGSCGCIRRKHKAVQNITETVVEPIVESAKKLTIEERVLAVFQLALKRKLPLPECYKAGIKVWQSQFPDCKYPYAAKHAVEIILKHRFTSLKNEVSDYR